MIDRRVARTRTALYDALLELVRRKDYDLISVEDILLEANVGRSTFYAHFASKDDLLESSLERLRQILTLELARESNTKPSTDCTRPSLSVALFEHMAEHADIQLALVGGRGAPIVKKAIDGVLTELLRGILTVVPTAHYSRQLTIRHIVATFNTVLRWWLEDRSRVSALEAEACFRNLIVRGIPREALAQLQDSRTLTDDPND